MTVPISSPCLIFRVTAVQEQHLRLDLTDHVGHLWCAVAQVDGDRDGCHLELLTGSPVRCHGRNLHLWMVERC